MILIKMQVVPKLSEVEKKHYIQSGDVLSGLC